MLSMCKSVKSVELLLHIILFFSSSSFSLSVTVCVSVDHFVALCLTMFSYSLNLYSICVCWPAAPFFRSFCFDSYYLHTGTLTHRHYPYAYADRWFGCTLGDWTNCVGHQKVHATKVERTKNNNVTMNYLLVNDSSQNESKWWTASLVLLNKKFTAPNEC